jgi:DTW domain-containing protein YfiP
MTEEHEPRAVCPRCRRPEVVCYCGHITEVPTRTRVVILQHPRERDVPINTARIANLCLPSSELHVGVSFRGTRVLERLLAERERPAVLLWPGPGAIDIETSPPEGDVTLVVVDGTWWQARKVVRQNPELAALPRYAFRPPAPSDYRIRKEPREEYVSTLEAIVHVLQVLERGQAPVDSLLVPFRAMVDAQLAYIHSVVARPRHTAYRERKALREGRADPADRLPPLLRDRRDDLVCVHAEANAWPYGSTERGACADELVHWSAHRLATGETFEGFVAPRGALAPATPRHVGVSAERLAQGGRVDELLARWRAFVRPRDVMVAWGSYGAGLFAALGGELTRERVDLRRAARVHAVAKVGTTEAFVASRELPVPGPLGEGRAGSRLAQMVAITRFLIRT